ncbi:MAG: class I SAM-dependent methyltransferase [Bacteroidota bacterium]|nr:class I SAM-dependent methyltransferase [Bacteroidota bacterium]
MKQQAYYEDLFKRGDESIWESAPGKTVVVNAIRHFTKTGRIPHDARIVDIGCGTGVLLERIRNEVPGNAFELFGLDFSREAITKAVRVRRGIRFACRDGTRTGLEDSSADVVVSYGAYEHFHSPEDGIRELSRILKASGLFFCMMPALGIDRTDRDDEGWYEERPVPGSPIRQMQHNLKRGTWENMFRACGLSLFPAEDAAAFGALKPGVFFFGFK